MRDLDFSPLLATRKPFVSQAEQIKRALRRARPPTTSMICANWIKQNETEEKEFFSCCRSTSVPQILSGVISNICWVIKCSAGEDGPLFICFQSVLVHATSICHQWRWKSLGWQSRPGLWCQPCEHVCSHIYNQQVWVRTRTPTNGDGKKSELCLFR